MKEFRAETGGRYTYNEDVLNLQELALAFNEIFTECDGFVVSGCQVTKGTISAGYVYLNKKIRRFPGAAGITEWPQYIVESNYTENTTYASGGPKLARTVYGCQISGQQPTAVDPVTGEIPAVLEVPRTGAVTIKDAFFGKYALVLNPIGSSQTVSGAVNFTSGISAGGEVASVGGFKTVSGNSNARVRYSGNDFELASTTESGSYRFAFESGGGFKFYVNDSLSLSVAGARIQCSVPIVASKADMGTVTLTGTGIAMEKVAAEGTLNINMAGFAGGYDYYRNTIIGDGKGAAVLSVYGAGRHITANASLSVNASSAIPLAIKANANKNSNNLVSYVSWSDNSGSAIAQFGFSTATDNVFRIKSLISGIEISGQDSVNIGPAIRENGALLSDKYVLSSSYAAAMAGKADKEAVYSKTEADEKLASKAGGFSQFVSEDCTALDLRTQIEAVGTNQLAAFPKLSNCLSDMAVDEDAKERIRNNIGACAAGDYQAKLVDTGWIPVTGNGLSARQIGNIVYVQGRFKIPHSGNVFTLPNSIDCPTRGVIYTLALANKRSWRCEIAPYQRNCVVRYCDGACDDYEYFTLSYMV